MVQVLVAGALHWDVVVTAPRLPRLDETLVGEGVDYRLGGKGANQAVAAARMGARVAMAGCVGQDAAAARLLAGLDAAGVDRSGVRAVPGPSGMSVAVVDAAGDYGAVIVSGANRALRADDVALPAGPGVVLLQNEVPAEVNEALAARLPPAVRLVLNAAPARALPGALLARVDVLVVNRVEAEQLSGSPDPAMAAAALRGQGARAVVVTLGGAGLLLAEGGAPASMPGHAVPVVSTHGAGDAFCGALAAALAGGAQLPEACRLGQAAAALTVLTPPALRGGITRAAAARLAGL